ncbi:hypothetical protein ED92_35030 [Amycolatopsis sp. MJM2582]|nr:hypothetical protein ED92_35030 [Amycolatopsis sp. MJM2582]
MDRSARAAIELCIGTGLSSVLHGRLLLPPTRMTGGSGSTEVLSITGGARMLAPPDSAAA